MDIRLNGQVLNDVELKPLAKDYQTSIGLRLAEETTKNNGINEIFIEHENKKYVIASDKTNFTEIKKGNSNDYMKLSIDGGEEKSVKILSVNEERDSTIATKKIAVKATKEGLFNGVGGVAAVAIPIALKLGGKDARIKPIALIAGFVGGFAWGAGTSITADVSAVTVKPTKWATIQSIVDENEKANKILNPTKKVK